MQRSGAATASTFGLERRTCLLVASCFSWPHHQRTPDTLRTGLLRALCLLLAAGPLTPLFYYEQDFNQACSARFDYLNGPRQPSRAALQAPVDGSQSPGDDRVG